MDKSNTPVKMIVCLVAIAIVTAALLAFVNGLTKPIIAANNENQLNDSLKTAIEADSFEVVSEEEKSFTVYEAKKGNEIAGYCVVNYSKGYGGDLKVMTGVDKNGAVTKVIILEHGETPGLGANSEKEEWRDQYIGKTKGVSVTKSEPGANEIKAISGATITSKGVTEAVNKALELAEKEAAK